MKFVDFLNEKIDELPVRKKELDRSSVIKLLQEKCKNVDLKFPFVRGMKAGADFYLLEAKGGGRKSLTGSNIVLSIVNKLLKDKFGNKAQLRDGSTIFANNSGEHHAKKFGSIYYILPFDNAILNYTDGHNDLNGIDINNDYDTASFAFDLKIATNLPNDVTYQDIIKAIQTLLDKDTDDLDYYEQELVALFNKESSIDDQLKDIYKKLIDCIKETDTKGFKVHTTAEVWTGDKVIAIKKEVYDEIIKEIKE